jgi:hypothetical protein
MLLSLQNLHFYSKPGESKCTWIDCEAGVVRDTAENFDEMEKEFGLSRR